MKEEVTDAFLDRLYQEAQGLLTFQKIYLDDSITAALSAINGQPHLQQYLKGIKISFRFILHIKKPTLDIPPNILPVHQGTSAHFFKRPCIASLSGKPKSAQ